MLLQEICNPKSVFGANGVSNKYNECDPSTVCNNPVESVGVSVPGKIEITNFLT